MKQVQIGTKVISISKNPVVGYVVRPPMIRSKEDKKTALLEIVTLDGKLTCLLANRFTVFKPLRVRSERPAKEVKAIRKIMKLRFIRKKNGNQ